MGCFLMGVTGPGITADGEALIGSVSDDPYDVRTFLRQVKPAGSQAHLGTELVSTTENTLVERGYFAHPNETTRGINESGLAFTCAMVFEKEGAEVKARPNSFAELTQDMMIRCRTVGDAIDLFQSAGATTPPFGTARRRKRRPCPYGDRCLWYKCQPPLLPRESRHGVCRKLLSFRDAG